MPVIRRPQLVEKENNIPAKLSNKYLREELGKKLIQQEDAINKIIPYITLFSAGLSSKQRPIGTFLLLGPTGSGKSRTVEVLADVLHEDESKMIKVDCGAFEASHEVAKLLGSPPGYLGHRETTPLFNQAKINNICSNGKPGIVLFDEIEKAHPNFYRVILSILEKGTLTLGDNAVVNFSDTLVFLTSNLGANKMMETINPSMGFSHKRPNINSLTRKMSSIGLNAVKKRFQPEFVNRLDEIITYEVLSENSISKIFDISFNRVRKLIEGQGNYLFISEEVKGYLIKEGFSVLYGARELNRSIQRLLVQPFANLIVDKELANGAVIKASMEDKVVLTIIDEAIVSNALSNI